MNKLAILAGLLCFGGMAASASAQVITLGTPTPASANEGDGAVGVVVSLSYTAPAMGAPAVVGADFTIPAEFTNVVGSNAQCIANQPEAGRVRVSIVEFVDPSIPNRPNFCTLTFDVSAAAADGNYNFTLCPAGTGACAGPTNVTVNFGAGFDVDPFAEPIIANPVFTAGAPAGSEGQVVQIGTTDFEITTAAEGAGEGSVSCVDDGGGPAFTFGAAITVNSVSASPVELATSCPLSPFGGGAVAGTATCTIEDANGSRQQQVNIDCPAATVETVGPTLNPPAQTTLTVPVRLQGSQSNVNIQYTAVGGDMGESTELTCGMLTGNVVLVSGAPQSVATGGTPVAIVVGVVLTDMEQTPAGEITCSANGVDTLFTINAPAGAVFIAPEIIPTSSLWSQLLLIGLLAGLGVVIVAVRRNA